MEYALTVLFASGISWLIADIKCKLHLKMIDQMFDECLNDLDKAHDEFFEKLSQKFKI